MSTLNTEETWTLAQLCKYHSRITDAMAAADPHLAQVRSISFDIENKLDGMVRAEKGYGIGDTVLDYKDVPYRVLGYTCSELGSTLHIQVERVRKDKKPGRISSFGIFANLKLAPI